MYITDIYKHICIYAHTCTHYRREPTDASTEPAQCGIAAQFAHTPKPAHIETTRIPQPANTEHLPSKSANYPAHKFAEENAKRGNSTGATLGARPFARGP